MFLLRMLRGTRLLLTSSIKTSFVVEASLLLDVLWAVYAYVGKVSVEAATGRWW
jgi:hypothetical protein